MSLNPASPEFLQALEAALPRKTIFSVDQKYLEEPRGRLHGQAAAVVKPRTTDEIATVVKLCNSFRVGLVPYGGGTGLVSGQLSTEGPVPVVLSLERMTSIRCVRPSENVIEVDAGALLSTVQSEATDVDRMFPLSLASEGSCQIGGCLATNAGGVQVLRYGTARDLCLGLEAVLPDGSVYRGLSRLRKDNTGYDIRGLLIGAEGTLGVISAASLKLTQQPADVHTAFLALSDPAAAITVLSALQDATNGQVSAFELISGVSADFLHALQPRLRMPFDKPWPWMALVEVGGRANGGLAELVNTELQALSAAGTIGDAVIATSAAQRAAFWHLRESIPVANKHIGAVCSTDISLPISEIPTFIAAAQSAIGKLTDARINCFGHLGDGNLHFNVFPAEGRDRAEYDDIGDDLTDLIYAMVVSSGGSISAEHGIGRLRRAPLEKFGDPARLAAMRAIKHALDPLGIMNPGAVVDP